MQNEETSKSDERHENPFDHLTFSRGIVQDSLLLDKPNDRRKRVKLTPAQAELLVTLMTHYERGVDSQSEGFNRKNISRLNEKLGEVFEGETYRLRALAKYGRGYIARVLDHEDSKDTLSFELDGQYLRLNAGVHNAMSCLAGGFGSVVGARSIAPSGDPKSSQARLYVSQIREEFGRVGVEKYEVANIPGTGYRLQYVEQRFGPKPSYSADPHAPALYGSSFMRSIHQASLSHNR